ncbi:MAG: phage portal protein [Pseudomonadota bacterium]
MPRWSHKLGGFIDEVILAINPTRGRSRQEDRFLTETLRQYAAAKTNVQTGSWGNSDPDANRVIGDSSPKLRARIRQLVRDFPFFARVLEVAVNLCISTGLSLQYLMAMMDGTVMKDVNRRVEEAWAEFCELVDAAGRLDFVELQRLARRQEMEVGECFGVTPLDPEDYAAPLKLQMYEPEWLNGYGASTSADREIIQGVEVDRRSGRILAYHLEDPEHWGRPQRVEREFAVHTFQTLRPGQVRGVSPLAAAVLSAHDIGEYIGAEVDAAKKAAAYLATAKSPNPAQYAMLRSKPDQDSGTRVRDLGRGIIEVLHSTEDFKLLDNNRPGTQFEATVNFITRMIAVTAGVSPELVSGDYRNINFSSLRGIRSDLLQSIRPIQRRFARQFCQPIFTRWLDAMVLNGALQLPNYWQQRARYHRAAKWQLPGIEGVDLLREARGAITLLAGGLDAPQEYLARRGLDPRDTLKAIAEFKRMAKEEGLELDWGRQALKTNPAALGASGNA